MKETHPRKKLSAAAGAAKKSGTERTTDSARTRGAHASVFKSQGFSKGKSKIFLVDDHPIVRQGLMELINRQETLVVCGEAENGPTALEQIARLSPDLAVIDVSLRNTSGIELIKSIRQHNPKVYLLVLSMHDESLYAERTLRAGARGYIMKQEAGHKILDAIHSVLGGEIFVSDELKETMVKHLVEGKADRDGFSISRLSDRELEVFQFIGKGLSTRQIARKLCLSVKTIESYRENLKQKMNLTRGTELLQQAILWSRNASPPV